MVLGHMASELTAEQRGERRIAGLVVDLVVLDLPALRISDRKAHLSSQATA